MSNKSIVALILVVIGIIIDFITVLSGPNINSENIAATLGMILPGILIATIVGFAIALIAHLFSKERAKDKFFLIFSIFFLLTILMIMYGTSENRKLEDKSINMNEVQRISSPYISKRIPSLYNLPVTLG